MNKSGVLEFAGFYGNGGASLTKELTDAIEKHKAKFAIASFRAGTGCADAVKAAGFKEITGYGTHGSTYRLNFYYWVKEELNAPGPVKKPTLRNRIGGLKRCTLR